MILGGNVETLKRSSGVTVIYPDSFRINEETPARRTRRGLPSGPVPMPEAGVDGAEQARTLLGALSEQEMELVDTLSIDPALETTPSSGRRRREAPSIPSRQKIKLDLELGDEEDAVILLEQDGVFSWSFPKKVSSTSQRERGSSSAARQQRVARTATFEIDIHASASPRRRSRLPSFITEMVYDKVRAYVLRFTARVAASGAMAFLERNIREGLVHIKSSDPESWTSVEPKKLKLPKDRQGSILLMVHGTFSSTLGSYGALGATPWGIDFLDNANANYDLILGFDHPTLSKDPLENAVEMLKALEAIGHKGQAAPKIDIVCFSRGGLVARSLLEFLLPASQWKPQIGTVAFVGCTNEGTLLAEPNNWHQLIDLYTNLSMAAFKVIEMLPSASAALGSRVLRHSVESLGAFVKYLTTHAVTENAIPGLAAMQPGGTFVTEINKAQHGQPTAQQAQYYAITSDFSPKLALDRDGLSGLPKKLLFMLADGFVDKLMGGDNDLVVHVDSMAAIDRPLGPYVKDIVEFKNTPDIYHTVYFTRPEVSSALSKWLGFAPSSGVRSPAARRMARKVVQPGDTVSPTLSATANTDVLVAPRYEKISDVMAKAHREKPEYVVLRRPHGGDILNYAVREEELWQLTKGYPASTTLEEVFIRGTLGEEDKSYTSVSMGRVVYSPRDETKKQPEIASRTVILDDGQVVGVVPTREDLPTLDELIVMAEPADGDEVEMTIPDASAREMPTRRRGGRLPSLGGLRGGSLPAGGSADIAARAPSAKRATPRKRSAKKKPQKRPAESVWCYFAARMDDEVQFGKTSTVQVEISREAIVRVLEGVTDETEGSVEKDRKIIIQLIPRRNFRTQGDDREEIDVPEPGDPKTLFFDAKPTNTGDGEVWVIVRQGSSPIVTLRLKTMIVKKAPTSPRVMRVATGVSSPPASGFDPWMTLRIFEQEEGKRARLRFDLEAKSINVLDWGESDLLKTDLREYVDKLYGEIEEGWVSAAGDTEAFTNELRAIGASMFRELFPAKMQRLLWDNRDKIKNIVLHSTEPYIPWELVHLREPNKRGMPKEMFFLGQKGLVRWLYGFGIPPATTRIQEGKVFYVVPNYPYQKYKLPAAQAEKAFLESEFVAKAWPNDGGLLMRKLEKPDSCDLFHFAGHGLAEGQDIDRARIMMKGKVQAGEYLPDYLSATTVGAFADLESDKHDKPMVMLNACQVGRLGYRLTEIGGFASAFLGAGAGIFVSTLWSVGDYAAQTFTEELYRQLKNKKSLTEAAIIAREAARKAGDTSWLSYTIYGNPDGVVEWEPKFVN